jgi:hypothetical protein
VEWLKRIFGRGECEACSVYTESTQRIMEYHRIHVASLELQIEDLKDQRDKAQEALFRVTRLTPQAPKEQAPQGKAAPGESRFTGSKRNWNDVRSELERQHRKPLPADQEKIDSWTRVNERAAQEIPELADALEKNGVIDKVEKTDLEILSEA